MKYWIELIYKWNKVRPLDELHCAFTYSGIILIEQFRCGTFSVQDIVQIEHQREKLGKRNILQK